jgi:chromosomal replication initiation ATPase DnaA
MERCNPCEVNIFNTKERGYFVHTPAMITRMVCQHFGVDLINVLSSRRDTHLVEVRNIIIHMIRRNPYMNVGYIELGRMFYKNHASIIHMYRNAELWKEVDPIFSHKLKECHRSIYGHLNYF